ncbi:fumarate hydratase [candidate division KSB1 bacterium]|nr:fumarate hydratase [bacterium]RKY84579.1 MAG: fumarate hydratase [candidate division KSB1 bacterium]RKY88348.1 MAG: fumarate hydratase [candidate division KSB1 bacterium]
MREIHVDKIVATVKKLCMEANYYLGDDVVQALQQALKTEESPLGRSILAQLIENQQIARSEQIPICQDTGFAVLFVNLGQEVRITGGNLIDAINEGVRQGYIEGYLRKSIVRDPLNRVNTGDNTPAVVHLEMSPGDRLSITIAPKGGGSENMSEVRVLKPADGVEGVKQFVIDLVRRSGGNPCPPIIVGVGIGGTFEKCAELAKRALLRELGSQHPDPFYANLEKELLSEINKLGIGPQGLGGSTTALAVFIEPYPCHIASLPVAVNIQCHAARHKSAVI